MRSVMKTWEMFNGSGYSYYWRACVQEDPSETCETERSHVKQASANAADKQEMASLLSVGHLC